MGKACSCLLNRRSFCFLALLAGASAFFVPKSAFAATWSSAGTYTTKGITFTYKSGLEEGAVKKASTLVTASKSVPAGTMKAQAILVNRLSKAVVASSAWASNAKGSSLLVSVTSSALISGYRSKGKVQCYGVLRNCAATAIGYARSALRKNEHGLICGTYEDVEVGFALDLLLVDSDSGVAGYVYWDQFSSQEDCGVLPVYAADGYTQVGIFSFGDK